MIVHNIATRNGLVPCAFFAVLLAAAPARGQPAPVPPNEIMAVVRISKDFIEDVATRVDIVADVPFQNIVVMGFNCHGVIHGQAKLAVEMNTAQGDATFLVNSHGTAQTYVRGVHGPIAVRGPAWGPFATRTIVRFEGRKFTVVQTTPWAQVNGELESIEGTNGGCVMNAVGRVALPIGKRLVPRAEAKATPIGLAILEDFVNLVAGQIVTRLNETTAVEKSLNRVYPETKDWVFQMSSDSQFLQAAYGPRSAKVPDLPRNPGGLKDVRIELWLHSTTSEAQELAKLAKQPLAKALVNKYIATILPELAALTDNRSVDAVGSWLVISIGAPKEK
jgi:hypothetical protein